MYAGNLADRKCRRSPAAGDRPVGVATRYATSRLSPGASSRAVTTHLAHPVVLLEGVLHLRRLDAEAAHLDLRVEPAEELERPVRAMTDEIPGLVKSVIRVVPEGVRDEFLGRQLRPVPVAQRDAVAADVQFGRHADGNRPPSLVQDVELGVGDRRPDRHRPGPGSTGPVADQTVVSVGPYMFHTEEERASNASARSRSSASPPHRALRFVGPFQPASMSNRQVAGVACITVAPDSLSRANSLLPSLAVSRVARTTRAPTQSGRYSSSTAMSNARVVTASSASWEASPGRHHRAKQIDHGAMRTCTPLGFPVDPDV